MTEFGGFWVSQTQFHGLTIDPTKWPFSILDPLSCHLSNDLYWFVSIDSCVLWTLDCLVRHSSTISCLTEDWGKSWNANSPKVILTFRCGLGDWGEILTLNIFLTGRRAARSTGIWYQKWHSTLSCIDCSFQKVDSAVEEAKFQSRHCTEFPKESDRGETFPPQIGRSYARF